MNADLVIVGAGAAGIGAAKAARSLGLECVVLEASHRIGGRAYTESVSPQISFDLGCHWLHAASRNPLTALLDRYDMRVTKSVFRPRFFADRGWLAQAEADACLEFRDTALQGMLDAARSGKDIAAVDAYARDHRWTPFMDYWTSLLTSSDPDMVAARDFTDFEDTGEGEDWPVREGYGTLVSRFGADVPVSLNCAVEEVRTTGREIVVRSNRGQHVAPALIITVSTGVLNARDIRFTPDLPEWKWEAITNLPLGIHNRVCLVYDRNIFGDCDAGDVVCLDGDDTPMFFEIRPFGLNYVVGSTGGRFADWLERAGQAASVDCAKEKLVQMFGANAGRHVSDAVVSAWRGDPWVRGAYSSTRPGCYGARRQLGLPLDDRIFFAGEAASENFMCTAHGAFISGVRASMQAASALGRKPGDPVSAEDLAWRLAQGGAD